jgi:hypothetical protein
MKLLRSVLAVVTSAGLIPTLRAEPYVEFEVVPDSLQIPEEGCTLVDNENVQANSNRAIEDEELFMHLMVESDPCVDGNNNSFHTMVMEY